MSAVISSFSNGEVDRKIKDFALRHTVRKGESDLNPGFSNQGSVLTFSHTEYIVKKPVMR